MKSSHHHKDMNKDTSKKPAAYVVNSVRVPFVKSFTHYMGVTTQQLMSASLQGLVERCQLQGRELGDVALGALINSSTDWNLARECVLDTDLDPCTPGYMVQRACGTSLETFVHICLKIERGMIDCGIAGGVDTNSDVPLLFPRSFAQKMLRLKASKTPFDRLKEALEFRPRDFKPLSPGVVEPRTGLSMGEHCEKMVQQWKISREDQDLLALESHQKGVRAYEEGFYGTPEMPGLVTPFKELSRDAILRADTTLDKLSRLKPAFEKSDVGTLTAGNSTPLSDGSAAVFVASESRAQQWGLKPLAEFVDAEFAGVNFPKGEGLLMAPTVAVARLLRRNGLKLQDFDFYEIHEAFSGQVLCTLKAWMSDDYCRERLGESKALGPIDRSRLNVKGGSVALGHPFAATGARVVGTLAKTLSEHQRPARGLISICTAGGMGVAAILKSV